MNLAIVGATGLVGRKMLEIIFERNLRFGSLRLFASNSSAGKTIKASNDANFIVEELQENSFKNIDVALFSAGSEVSIKYVPIATEQKCIVIDNGSY